MEISEHAIRRYKKRVGKKSASRKRIVTLINRDLKNDVWFRRTKNKEEYHDAYVLVTSKYQAVCVKNLVVTIEKLPPDVKAQWKLKHEHQHGKREKVIG